jgi:hypothetical protein
MNKHLLFFIALVSYFSLSGQEDYDTQPPMGRLFISCIDNSTNNKIENVSIRLSSRDSIVFSCSTNQKGECVFNLLPGKYKIYAEGKGYKPYYELSYNIKDLEDDSLKIILLKSNPK